MKSHNLLWIAFSLSKYFKTHLLYRYRIPFYCWTVFHCMDVPHFIYRSVDGHGVVSTLGVLGHVALKNPHVSFCVDVFSFLVGRHLGAEVPRLYPQKRWESGEERGMGRGGGEGSQLGVQGRPLWGGENQPVLCRKSSEGGIFQAEWTWPQAMTWHLEARKDGAKATRGWDQAMRLERWPGISHSVLTSPFDIISTLQKKSHARGISRVSQTSQFTPTFSTSAFSFSLYVSTFFKSIF